MTAMLQVVFMAIGLAVLTFVIAFLFRKWQRAILWAVALLLFVGTSILLGAGVLKIYENGMMNHAVLLCGIVSCFYACLFVNITKMRLFMFIHLIKIDNKTTALLIFSNNADCH